MGTGEFTAGGNPAMDQHPIQGGVEILLVASCYGNRDKLRRYEPLVGSTQTLPFFLYITKQTSVENKKKYQVQEGAVFN